MAHIKDKVLIRALKHWIATEKNSNCVVLGFIVIALDTDFKLALRC